MGIALVNCRRSANAGIESEGDSEGRDEVRIEK